MKKKFKLTMGLLMMVGLSFNPLSASAESVSYNGFDETKPIVSQVYVDSTTQFVPGDEVEISVDVVEEETGIREIKVGLTHSTGDVRWFYLPTKNELGNNLSGRYTKSFIVPEDMKQGEWHIGYIYIYDMEENQDVIYDYYSTIFNIDNDVDITLPVLVDTYPEYKTLEAGSTQIINVICDDDDLAKIRIGLESERAFSYNRDIYYNVEEISEDGLYQIEVPMTDMIDEDWCYFIVLTDKAGNDNNSPGVSSTVFHTTCNEKIVDVAPIIDSVTTSTSSITLPGEFKMTISGTEDKSDKVVGQFKLEHMSIEGQYLPVDFAAKVVDGKWVANVSVSFDHKLVKTGTYGLGCILVFDDKNVTASYDFDYLKWNISLPKVEEDKPVIPTPSPSVEEVKPVIPTTAPSTSSVSTEVIKPMVSVKPSTNVEVKPVVSTEEVKLTITSSTANTLVTEDKSIILMSSSKVEEVKPVVVKSVKKSDIKITKKTLKVNKVKNVTGYQIKYSSNKKMKNAKTKFIKAGKNIKFSKKTYVRIRAYKVVDGKKIYGSWSAIKTIK